MISFTTTQSPREQRAEGSIASVFTSLSGATQPLPGHFTDLKKEIWKDDLVQSWREVLTALEGAVDEVCTKGGSVSLHCIFKTNSEVGFLPRQIIPRVAYADITKGLSPEQIKTIRQTGTIIVSGGVPKEVGVVLASIN
jgi:hypothetical protein